MNSIAPLRRLAAVAVVIGAALIATTCPAIADEITITGVSVDDVGETGATITWSTNMPASSSVSYGNTTSLGFTTSEATLVEEHAITLEGLEPGTRYYFEVQSSTGDGSAATDNNGGFYYAFLTDEIPSAGDGLFISVVGMTAVFVVLVVIMGLMIWIQRLFSDKETPPGSGALFAPNAEVSLSAGRTKASSPAGEEGADLDSVLRTIGVDVEHRPSDHAEVAAIALAVASHMKERGLELHGRLTIGDIEYRVSVGPPWDFPVPVVVDDERFWASLDGRGLPVGGGITPLRAGRIGEPERGQRWRSAYPMPIGQQWDRRGWSRRR